MAEKVHLPWTDRNPAEWAEDDIPTEGGNYGWDHTRGVQPIPGERRQIWARRRRTYEENAAAVPSLFADNNQGEH